MRHPSIPPSLSLCGALLLAAGCVISRGIVVEPLHLGRSDSTTVATPVTVARNLAIGQGVRYDAAARESTAVRQIALDSAVGTSAPSR